MRRLAFLLIALGILLAVAGIDAASAQVRPYPRIPFRLDANSVFQQGCFAPCMCPILEVRDLSGRFVLRPVGHDGGYAVFEVSRVDWEVPRGDGSRHVQGAGTYRIDPRRSLQRLELDLQIDDEPVEHYDSGIVAAKERFPRIDITISINGMFCFDTVFEVRAAPAPLSVSPLVELPAKMLEAPEAGTSWGMLKADFRP
jgi:hypothetical protein